MLLIPALIQVGCIDKKEMKTTPAVSEFLGKDILAIVSDPDEIHSFRVIPKQAPEGDRIGMYPIDEEGPKLSPEQKDVLVGVVLDEKTYNFESAKRGFHVPEYAFKFIKGTKEVGMLVDLYRNEVVFLFENDEERTEDCDDARDVLESLVKGIFPEKPKT